MNSGNANPLRPPRILVCAVEPSADALGAELMKSMRAYAADVEFLGCGGPLMSDQGLASLFPIEPFSVMGPVDALGALPAARRGARLLAEAAAQEKADAAVLIDGWAFARMAAERIRKLAPQTRLIKYVAPQVWASRPHRAKTVARLFDGVLTLFPFENEWFERENISTHAVGSSAFQSAAKAKQSVEDFRRRHNIGSGKLLAVLPGSRIGEVNRLLEPFRETVDRVNAEIPDLQVVIPAAPSLEETIQRATANWSRQPIIVPASERYCVFAASDAALAASGTVTTELAIFETPMIVAYRVGWLSAFWFRRVITTPYVSLLNVVADRPVIPEFLQEACRPDNMAAALASLIVDARARSDQIEAFPGLLRQLGIAGPPASEAAAQAVFEWIDAKNSLQAQENV